MRFQQDNCDDVEDGASGEFWLQKIDMNQGLYKKWVLMGVNLTMVNCNMNQNQSWCLTC